MSEAQEITIKPADNGYIVEVEGANMYDHQRFIVTDLDALLNLVADTVTPPALDYDTSMKIARAGQDSQSIDTRTFHDIAQTQEQG